MYIQTQKKLIQACEHFAQKQWIAIDTEFVREKHYYPIISLVQISDGEKSIVIDMLKKLDFEPLVKILENKAILKVFHSARQDIEAIFWRFGVVTKPIFDTQIAALFLNFEEAPGFGNLVSQFLGEKVCKRLQFSNWLKRPLDEEYLEYAVNDARLLALVYPKIKISLEEQKKLEMTLNECTELYSKADFYPTETSLLAKFLPAFNDHDKLNKALQLLRIREKLAVEKNLARANIAHDDAIIEFVNSGKIRKTQNFGLLISAFKTTCNPEIKAKDEIVIKNTIIRGQERGPRNFQLIDILKMLLANISQVYAINASLIANRDELSRFAQGKPSKIITGWRRKIFGNLASDIKNGKLFITFKEGKLSLKRGYLLFKKDVELKNELD